MHKLVALMQGKYIHGYIIGTGFELDVFVDSSLVDMHAKSGSVGNARQVFDKLSLQEVCYMDHHDYRIFQN